MAEIKSTWELVKEKLEDIEISPEERERFRKEKVRSRAMQVYNRYFRPPIRAGEELKEAVRGDEELRREVFLLAAEQFPLDDPPEGYGEAMEAVAQREIGDRLKEIVNEYRREREGKLREIKEEMIVTLSSRGIKGDAIDPNPDAHPHWRGFLEELQRRTKDRLKALL